MVIRVVHKISVANQGCSESFVWALYKGQSLVSKNDPKLPECSPRAAKSLPCTHVLPKVHHVFCTCLRSSGGNGGNLQVMASTIAPEASHVIVMGKSQDLVRSEVSWGCLPCLSCLWLSFVLLPLKSIWGQKCPWEKCPAVFNSFSTTWAVSNLIWTVYSYTGISTRKSKLVSSLSKPPLSRKWCSRLFHSIDHKR